MMKQRDPVLKRLENWPERLAEFIEARREASFEWGVNDCCLFAADAVLEITGVDLADREARYSTEEEAEALLEARGGLVGLLAATGLRECAVPLAQRGDVVLMADDNLRGLGVVLGPYVAHPTLRGLAFIPRGACVRAWAV